MAQEQIQQQPEMQQEVKVKLIKAIGDDDIPTVREILTESKGMNLDFQHNGYTPLRKACLIRNLEICKMLL